MTSTSTLQFLRSHSDHPDFQLLIKQLDAYLTVINGEQDGFYKQHNVSNLVPQVLIAYREQIPVGCGALKEIDAHTMEIKRMFVPPDKRKQGIAFAILTELQSWATELGYKRFILETGKSMSDAQALYRKFGFKQIPNYGPYTQIEESCCFEMRW